MHKFVCEKCAHEAMEKGFCPKDGAELKAKEISLADVIGKIGEVVKAQVKEAAKEYGFGDKPKSMPAPKTLTERLDHVKSILTSHDAKALEGMVDEKDQKKFLMKCRTAYFFKHVAQAHITNDPIHAEHAKALATGVDADGGYLVPTEFRADLIQDLKDLGFLRGLVTVLPMRTNSMEVPKLLTDVVTTWGTENAAIGTTTASFGTLTLAPKRLNAMMYVSRELVSDSQAGVEIMEVIRGLFVDAVGRAEDTAIISGNGTTQPKGITQETLQGIDNANVDANLADNLKKLPYRLSKRYRKNASWLINSKALEQIETLKDSQNNYLLRRLAEGPAYTDRGIEFTIAGLPVYEQNDLPLDTAILGDLKKYFLGDREQMSIEMTTEGAGTFEKHQLAIKITERIDGKVALTLAFRALTNMGVD